MSDQLHTHAREIANWMKYLMDANPGLGRMCRSNISNEGDGILVTQPVSLREDYDALMRELDGREG